MKANDTLITPQECIEFAPIDGNSYGEQRLNFIVSKEEQLFRKCFGYDFYISLMTDKIKYSLDVVSETTQYFNFQENVVYSPGTYLLHKGSIYKVVKLTTGKQTPPNQSYFEEAEKFANESYDYLWKRYLRRILAFCINNDSMFFRVVRETAKGVGQVQDDTFKPISTKSAATLRQEYLKEIDDMTENCRLFILSNPTDYVDCQFVKDSCESDCTKRKVKHYGFNTNK